jgi:hypothetical protein
MINVSLPKIFELKVALTPTNLKMAETCACQNELKPINSPVEWGLPEPICINETYSISWRSGKIFVQRNPPFRNKIGNLTLNPYIRFQW